MARYESMEVWIMSRSLCSEIYKEFQDLKDFGFKDQITRSSLSIPSNIAEGFERRSQKELANFLNYAKGSAGELRCQIFVAMDVGYLEQEKGVSWLKKTGRISGMLYSLIEKIKNDNNPDLRE